MILIIKLQLKAASATKGAAPKDTTKPTSASTLDNRKGTPDRKKSEHIELPPPSNTPPNSFLSEKGGKPPL